MNTLPMSSPIDSGVGHQYQNSTPKKQITPSPNDTHVDDDDLNPFDEIATNINHTLSELDSIYNTIGYSNEEISSKKSEIFNIIQDTICNFSNNVNREKSNIENECEWLRQQIQIILSMINDNKGDKNLTLIQKGLVFKNQTLFEDGYKEEILNKITQIQNGESLDIRIDQDLSIEKQYDYMTSNIPKLSLLQQRNKLNDIFLDVLKSFVKLFKQLNLINLQYIELVDIIGFDNSLDPKLNTLPIKSDALFQQQVIEEFEDITKRVRSQNKPCILASPVKNSPQRKSSETIDDDFLKLRDLNYQLVKIIRGLKLTKITQEFLTHIKSEIDKGTEIMKSRINQVSSILNSCFEYIELLNLSNDQIIDLQTTGEAILDLETLELILRDPQSFGLNDDHLNFLLNFQKNLETTYESKKNKWHEYYNTCVQLWEKLNESTEYIENFLKRNSSISDLSLLNFKMELNKLYIRRSEYIGTFIRDTRIEIEKLWDKLYYSVEMREKFQYFNYDPDQDETNKEIVLNKHELEVKTLSQEYLEKKPIFQLYDELNNLIKDQDFLTESSKDSSRLLSKNSCKILLNEERIRKKINKNMPKILESLKKEVSNYNNAAIARNEKPLSINGEDFFEKILFISNEQFKSKSRTKPKSPIKPKPLVKTSPERKSPVRIPKVNKVQKKPLLRFNSSILESPTQASRMNSVQNKPPELPPLASPLKPLNRDRQFVKPKPSFLEDKENISSPFDFSPIKLNKYQDEISNADISTLVGDDYLNWRDERIKQLNEI